ncbi:hypothetical protein [Peptostreptococcus equinus]|uniref:Uncharacterized protein n=1 Tax=Peptostreptococcus equinus TaxID=3003601 RepID=A0ABY7JRL9_9FIRM|nr:hypothetical protein [Peptostreptococcus sp. CBA3647]WAW14625.1 hypothetical protein O0R46_08480 [Peptostreptococcus sp. CBA3647]WAW15264.1 hypothetical protein O0R46_02095 [Peptostreptococcus sp. CBA3647]
MTKKEKLLEDIEWSIDDNIGLDITIETNGRKAIVPYSVSQLDAYKKVIERDFDDELNYTHKSVEQMNCRIIDWKIWEVE